MLTAKYLKQAGIPVIGVLHTDDPKGVWLQEEFFAGSKDFALSALVCVSELLQEKVAPLNIYNIPVEVISCGTPVLVQEVGRDDHLLKLVYAGKLTEEAKQISLLTQAFCRAVKEIEGVEAYIYGDGPAKEKVLNIIDSEAKDYPVFYKGFVDSSQVQANIQDKHVVVLLSDYEGLPIVLLEGMACGLVPVCLDIRSGIPELVKQNETGCLVKDRGDDFIATIKKLKEDSVLFNRLAKNAKAFALNNHSMDVVTDKWIQLYDQLKVENARKAVIKIPFTIKLPKIHAHLKGIDVRKSSLSTYLIDQFLRLTRIFNKK